MPPSLPSLSPPSPPKDRGDECFRGLLHVLDAPLHRHEALRELRPTFEDDMIDLLEDDE